MLARVNTCACYRNKPCPKDSFCAGGLNAPKSAAKNKQAWIGRIDKPQMIADGNLAAAATTSSTMRNKQYCMWRPGLPAQVNQLLEPNATDSFGYTLSFRKDVQMAVSSIFEIQGDSGTVAATLECYFPQSQTPADLTIGRWLSIVGKLVRLDIRSR